MPQRFCRRVTQQPRRLSEPNPAQSLASSLIAVFNPGESLRFGAQFPATVGGTQTVGAPGKGLLYPGNTKTQYPFEAAIANALASYAGCAVLVVFDVNSLTNYGGLFTSQDTSTDRNCCELRLGDGPTDSNILLTRGTTGGASAYRQFSTGANRLAAGDKGIRLLLSCPDADVQSAPKVYINGVQYATSLVGIGAATGAVQAATSVGVSLGGRSCDTVTPLDGVIYGAWVFSRAATPAEGISLTRSPLSPYQLFASLPRRKLVSANISNIAASGGDVAGGSAVLSASYSLAAVAVSVAGGSAALKANVALAATGLSIAGGSAGAVATVTIAASALAQAAGSAGLAVTVTLAASGGAVAGGSAALSSSSGGAIAASGGAVAGGSALMSATVQISAIGLAQALGAGALSVSIPLSAFAHAVAGGQATLGSGAFAAGPLMLVGSASRAATLAGAARKAATVQGSVAHV